MEPLRLLDDEECREVHSLLHAGISDAPPREARARVLGALGLLATLTAVAAKAAGVSSGGKSLLGVSFATLAKLTAGGVVVGTVVAVSAFVAPPQGAEPQESFAPAPLEAARAVAPPQPVRAAREPTTAVEVPATSGEIPKSTSVSSARAPSAAPSHGAAPKVDTLPQEIALLDRARNATARGKPNEALALLDRYGREYPSSRLAPEVFVSRIEALLRAGRDDEARALARQWLASHPGGATSTRIRKLLPRDQESNDRE